MTTSSPTGASDGRLARPRPLPRSTGPPGALRGSRASQSRTRVAALLVLGVLLLGGLSHAAAKQKTTKADADGDGVADT
jgi:hypothetical protein